MTMTSNKAKAKRKTGKIGKTKGRFRIGRTGGAEALLFEFQDWDHIKKENKGSDEKATEGRIVENGRNESGFDNLVRIAAISFEDAVSLLRRSHPRFRVKRAYCVGLVELDSGSPLH